MSPASKIPDKANCRKRVSLACEQCRSRRSRLSKDEQCDGEQPICGPCVQKNARCEYRDEGNKRKPPSKRYVESLHAHIAILEERLIALGQEVTKLDTTHVKDIDSADGNSASAMEQNIQTDAARSSSSVSATSLNLPDPVDEIVQRVGRLNVGEDGQLRYFGAQSNYNLLHGHLYDESTHSLQQVQDIGLAAADVLGKSFDISEELQDHLLELYWRWQNPFIYMIHKSSFMQDYRNKIRGKYCSNLLLSAIFALSSRLSDRLDVRSDPTDPHSAGNNFAEQAKILLLYECEAPTILTVQAASLLSLRWMSENKESLGWLYMGMATRMAYNLGLHLDCSQWVKSGIITEQDAQVRNITWWGCYKLDKCVFPIAMVEMAHDPGKNFIALLTQFTLWWIRLYCLGLGRPGTTKPFDITCQKPKLEPDVEFEPWVPWGRSDEALLGAHSRIHSAMKYSCDHLSLISESLEKIYAPGGITEAAAVKLVAEADVKFNAFYTALPSHLRLPPPRIPCLPHIYQLHVQFHVLQIQLHRSLISRQPVLLERGLNDAVSPDFHLKACRRSATAISRILRMYQYHYTLRLTPIVTVVNTFSAAVIHLMDAASLDPEIRRSAYRNLKVCVSSLDTMALAWMWSRRALRAVRLLAQEWLIPQAVTSAETNPTSFQSPLGPRQLDSTSRNPGETLLMPAKSGPEATTDPQGWEFTASTLGNLPFDDEYGGQSILAMLFGEENLSTGVARNDSLFDSDATSHLRGDHDLFGPAADPWVMSALGQNPFSLDPLNGFSDQPHSREMGGFSGLEQLDQNDPWPLNQW